MGSAEPQVPNASDVQQAGTTADGFQLVIEAL